MKQNTGAMLLTIDQIQPKLHKENEHGILTILQYTFNPVLMCLTIFSVLNFYVGHRIFQNHLVVSQRWSDASGCAPVTKRCCALHTYLTEISHTPHLTRSASALSPLLPPHIAAVKSSLSCGEYGKDKVATASCTGVLTDCTRKLTQDRKEIPALYNYNVH